LRFDGSQLQQFSGRDFWHELQLGGERNSSDHAKDKRDRRSNRGEALAASASTASLKIEVYSRVPRAAI
jgi:hypothetical protein